MKDLETIINSVYRWGKRNEIDAQPDIDEMTIADAITEIEKLFKEKVDRHQSDTIERFITSFIGQTFSEEYTAEDWLREELPKLIKLTK